MAEVIDNNETSLITKLRAAARGLHWHSYPYCAKGVEEAITHIITLTEQNETLKKALEEAREQFAFYAREHERAGKTEKAATNQKFANMLEAALTKGLTNG